MVIGPDQTRFPHSQQHGRLDRFLFPPPHVDCLGKSHQTVALSKKIDKIAEAGSLVPGDVHNCVRRIVAVQEALDR